MEAAWRGPESGMRNWPHLLWIAFVVFLGLIISPNVLGWSLFALIAVLIFPSLWERLEREGKPSFSGARMVVAVMFTIFTAYTAWSRTGQELQIGDLEVKAAVSASLRDPTSAEFRNIIEGASATCGEVNGKNGFGAYAGFKPFVYESGIVRFAPEEPVVPNIQQHTSYYQALSEFTAARRRCYE